MSLSTDLVRVTFHTAEVIFVRTMTREELHQYQYKISETPPGALWGITLPENDRAHECWVPCNRITYIVIESGEQSA